MPRPYYPGPKDPHPVVAARFRTCRWASARSETCRHDRVTFLPAGVIATWPQTSRSAEIDLADREVCRHVNTPHLNGIWVYGPYGCPGFGGAIGCPGPFGN